MVENCPRCSSRLGPPLRSGRQVCAECGWSTSPARSSQASEPSKSPSGMVQLLKTCGRIVQRLVSLVFQWVKAQFQNYQQTRTKNQVRPGEMISGLSDRLSALEQSIPTSTVKVKWLTPETAFVQLGGDLSNPQSVVRTTNGTAAITLARFRMLKSETDWRAFGFEVNPSRREANKPWLRQIQ